MSETKCPRCGKQLNIYRELRPGLSFIEACSSCGWVRQVPSDETLKYLKNVATSYFVKQCLDTEDIQNLCRRCSHRVEHRTYMGKNQWRSLASHCEYGFPLTSSANQEECQQLCEKFEPGSPKTLELLRDNLPDETWYQWYLAAAHYYDFMGITFDDFMKVVRGLEAYE